MRLLMPALTAPFEPVSIGSSPVGLARSPQSAMRTLLITRDRKKIGAYLLDHEILIMLHEEDRQAAVGALSAAGYQVSPSLSPAVKGESLLRLNLIAVGNWGNVLLFEAELKQYRINFRVALYDIDSKTLCSVARDLNPGITRLLDLMGLEVASTNWVDTPSSLRNKLTLEVTDWGYERAVAGPHTADSIVSDNRIVRSLSKSAALRVPPEIAAAVNQLFSVPVVDPFVEEVTIRPGDPAQGFWSSQHGVLGRWELPKLREVGLLEGISLPPDWREHWAVALELSPSHAPALTALSLHDAHPDWWATLPVSLSRERLSGVWLLGHSDKKPTWIQSDLTGDEEDRLGSAVAAIVVASGDLDWLERTSALKQECALCGRPFTPSRLAAGLVAQLRTSKVCHLCVRVGVTTPPLSSSPTLQAGAEAAVRELIRQAGRVVSVSMIPNLLAHGDIDPVTMILLRHALPESTEGGWATWLARAGVLGDSWRPSRGYVSIAADGHECRSLFERVVDDFLWAHGIEHDTEPPYPFDEKLNPHGSRADWKLADGRYIEAAGLMSKEEYALKMARKQQLAAKYGIKLVVLTEADLPRLKEVLN